MDRFSIPKRSVGSEDLPCTLWFPKGVLTGCILMGHDLGADREHMTNQVAVDALLPMGWLCWQWTRRSMVNDRRDPIRPTLG